MKNALNMVTVAQFFFKKIPNLPFLVGNLKNGGLGNFVLKIELWGLYLEHFSFYYVFSLKMKNALKIVPIAQLSKTNYLTQHF